MPSAALEKRGKQARTLSWTERRVRRQGGRLDDRRSDPSRPKLRTAATPSCRQHLLTTSESRLTVQILAFWHVFCVDNMTPPPFNCSIGFFKDLGQLDFVRYDTA